MIQPYSFSQSLSLFSQRGSINGPLSSSVTRKFFSQHPVHSSSYRSTPTLWIQVSIQQPIYFMRRSRPMIDRVARYPIHADSEKTNMVTIKRYPCSDDSTLPTPAEFSPSYPRSRRLASVILTAACGGDRIHWQPHISFYLYQCFPTLYLQNSCTIFLSWLTGRCFPCSKSGSGPPEAAWTKRGAIPSIPWIRTELNFLSYSSSSYYNYIYSSSPHLL